MLIHFLQLHHFLKIWLSHQELRHSIWINCSGNIKYSGRSVLATIIEGYNKIWAGLSLYFMRFWDAPADAQILLCLIDSLHTDFKEWKCLFWFLSLSHWFPHTPTRAHTPPDMRTHRHTCAHTARRAHTPPDVRTHRQTCHSRNIYGRMTNTEDANMMLTKISSIKIHDLWTPIKKFITIFNFVWRR